MWYTVYTRASAWRLLLGHKHMILSNFIYRAPNRLMLIWDSSILTCSHLKLYWISISVWYSTSWSCIAHFMPADSFRSIIPTQILLIFESMQCIVEMTKNRRKSFNTFFLFCFHATYISNLDKMLCSHSRWPYKMHCCNYCIFWSLLPVYKLLCTK